MGMMASTMYMPEPVCIINNSEDGKLCINEEAVQILDEITQPVVVVAVAGLYCTEKSYLLNRLAGIDGKHNGFALGATMRPKTKGIWMWCVPHPRNNNHTLVLLETKGLGVVKKEDEKHDVWIFTLAALLSSTLVYNSKGTIDTKALEKLQYPSLYLTGHKHHLAAKLNPGAGAALHSQPAEFIHVYPSLVWTVRDFTQQLESEGNQITEDYYLEKALTLKKEWQRGIFSDESRFSLGGDAQRIRVWRHRGQHQDEWSVVTRPEGLVSLHLQPYRTICRNCVRMFKLHGMEYHRTPLGTSTAPYRDIWRVGLANTAARRHTERNTDDIKKHNLPRSHLQDLFAMKKCFVFERPVLDPDKMDRLEKLEDKDLNPHFVEKANDFCEYIFTESKTKTMKGGLELSGRMLATLAETYVKAINSGQTPCVEQAVEILKQTLYSQAEGKDSHGKLNSGSHESSNKYVMEVERYTRENQKAVEKVLKYFRGDVLSHMVLLFTHGDKLEENKTIQDFINHDADVEGKRQKLMLKDLAEKCGNRVHVIDNKYWNQNKASALLAELQKLNVSQQAMDNIMKEVQAQQADEMPWWNILSETGDSEEQIREYRTNRFQLTQLMKSIKILIEKNNKPFKNEALEEIGEAIKKEVKNILQEMKDKGEITDMTEADMVKIRRRAKERVKTKLERQLAGVATGSLLGALLGVGVGVAAPVVLVAGLIRAGWRKVTHQRSQGEGAPVEKTDVGVGAAAGAGVVAGVGAEVAGLSVAAGGAEAAVLGAGAATGIGAAVGGGVLLLYGAGKGAVTGFKAAETADNPNQAARNAAQAVGDKAGDVLKACWNVGSKTKTGDKAEGK
ncbi:hypothetical protein NFI96_003887 [Prochilodus magdalenae]|nr:hypothetical protein NFI96_003887 [Prochilodus magdalenae]